MPATIPPRRTTATRGSQLPGHPGVQVHTLRSGGPISPLVLSKPAGVILDRPRFGVYSN